MKLQTKIFLAITGLLVITVIATAFVTTRGATQSMITQMEEDGITIAQLLARSSNFAVYVPQQVEDIVGDQMVVEARIAAHLVAVAEGQAGMSPQEINTILRDIARGCPAGGSAALGSRGAGAGSGPGIFAD